MKLFLIICLISISGLGISQNDLTSDYIRQWDRIAISEMHRTGIPASITLAQGLLESDWGRSELALKSNNHFGIKCSGEWEGDAHYRHDDEYTSLGLKKKSCFRVYDSAEESFFDHSNFLTDENKRKRYGFLFEFDTNDYRSWAQGLKKSGYATDPNYDSKLISIIEKYELWKYDQDFEGEEVIVSIQPAGKTVVDNSDFDFRITYKNSCKVVLVGRAQTVHKLAKDIGVSTRKIFRYNPRIHKQSDILGAGEFVYLDKKKSYYLGDEEFHKIDPGQTIQDVAELYGIDAEYLLLINKLDKNTELGAGSLLSLKSGFTPRISHSSPKKEIRELLVDNTNYLFEKALQPFKQ